MSYVSDGFQFYRNPRPVYYQGSRFEPVPGWGVVAKVMAGPQRLAVGQPPALPESEEPSTLALVGVMALTVFAAYATFRAGEESRRR